MNEVKLVTIDFQPDQEPKEEGDFVTVFDATIDISGETLRKLLDVRRKKLPDEIKLVTTRKLYNRIHTLNKEIEKLTANAIRELIVNEFPHNDVKIEDHGIRFEGYDYWSIYDRDTVRETITLSFEMESMGTIN